MTEFEMLESLRRERSGAMNTAPLAEPLQFEVRDYADAGLRIQAAMAHLDEALPNGQPARVVAAYNMLRRGTEDLGRWLRAKGMMV